MGCIAWNEPLLIGLNGADEPSRVLLGEEALRNDDVQIDSDAKRRQGHQQHQELMPQDPGERALVQAEAPLEHAFAGAIQPSVVLLALGAEEERAHHRRRGEGDHE